MSDILLTHGYFLAEDEKERQVMKPYPPLGLLSLSAYLKARGHAVEIYDSTFGEPLELQQKLRQSPRGLLGIYTNLITRKTVLDIILVAKQCDWSVILGGPESPNYPARWRLPGSCPPIRGGPESCVRRPRERARTWAASRNNPRRDPDRAYPGVR